MIPPDPPAGPADRELLDALGQGGDPARRSWPVLVARHTPRLYAVARSFVADPQTAEDLVQTAWLRLLDRIHQLRDPDAVGPWLCAIVRNEARRALARRREYPVSAPIEAGTPGADTADGPLLRRERDRALRQSFADLSPDCRQLLSLVLADPPLRYDEIAAALGRPRGSLGPARRRCLEALRARLPAGFEP